MKNDVKNFLDKHNWDYKLVSGNQLCVKVCPLCGDDRNKFYMNQDNGLNDCKICGWSGNIYQLQAKLGGLDDITSVTEMISKKYKSLDNRITEEFVKNLKGNSTALNYLRERGFADDIIDHFKLGCENNWITIPHFQDKKLWNIKKRNYVEKEFIRIAGQPTVLFNIDNIRTDKPTIVLVESETDTIAAYQMGIKNVIGLTAGAETFKPKWIPFFRQFKKVFVCLNSDTVGQKGAYKLAEKIGFDKCRNVILPTNDVNDYLQEYSSEDFLNEFGKARQFNLKNVTDMSEYIDNIDEWFDEDGSMSGIQTQYEKLNSFLAGLKKEDLIIVSGDTGIGKTTFNLNILYHFLKNNRRCLGFFLEGKIMYYIMRMMSIHTRKNMDDLRKNEEDWLNTKEIFSSMPMFFYSGSQSDLDFHKLKDLMSAAVKLYDIEYVLIDNLQRLVKSSRDVVNETSAAVAELKSLAVDLQIPIVLISHIKKIERGVKRIVMHDAKSSSTIYQDSDIYLVLWDNKNIEEQENDLILTIEKNRMGEGGKDIPMIYNKELAIFQERIEEIDGKSKISYNKKSTSLKKGNVKIITED